MQATILSSIRLLNWMSKHFNHRNSGFLAVTNNGQRFLLIRPLDREAQTSITLVQGWTEGLVGE